MSDINEIIKALESELSGRGLHSQLPRKTRRAMERILTKYMDKVQVEGEDDKRYFIGTRAGTTGSGSPSTTRSSN